jgi:hypothetical protein
MTITMLSTGGAKLEIFTFTQPMTGCPWSPGADFAGLRHLGLETGDLDAATRQATDAGAHIAAGPGDGTGRPRAMLTDRDGIPLEIVATA